MSLDLLLVPSTKIQLTNVRIRLIHVRHRVLCNVL